MGASKQVESENNSYINNIIGMFWSTSAVSKTAETTTQTTVVYDQKVQQNLMYEQLLSNLDTSLKNLLAACDNDVDEALERVDAALIRLYILSAKVGSIIGEKFYSEPKLTKEELAAFNAINDQFVAKGIYSQEFVTNLNEAITQFKQELKPLLEEYLAESKLSVAKPRPGF